MFNGVPGPVLSIASDADSYVTEASCRRALSPLVNANVEEVMLGEAEQGQHRGHASWTKALEGVGAAAVQWLQGRRLLL